MSLSVSLHYLLNVNSQFSILAGRPRELALQARPQAPRAAWPDLCRQELQGAALQGPFCQQGPSFKALQLLEA